jgi:hypothetical protein
MLVLIGVISIISVLQSCKTLKVKTKSAVFYEMTREYAIIDGKKELVYIEPFSYYYYYHISTTIKNNTKGNVFIDLNTCKLKIGDKCLSMRTCVNGINTANKIDTLIIKPKEKILFNLYDENGDFFFSDLDFSLYIDFYDNFSKYLKKLNENTILEFECSGEINAKISIPITTFITYNEESEISKFRNKHRCE